MNTTFRNSKNSRAPDPHRLLLDLADKTKLREVINMLLFQASAFTVNGKI